MHFALLEKWNCAPSINLPQLEVLIGTRNRHLRLSFSGWRRLCDSDWLQWTRSLEFCFHAMSHYLDLYWKLKIHVNHLFRLMSFSGLTRRRSHGIWANWMILPSNWKKQMLKGKLAVQKMVVNLMDSVCEGWDREYLHTQSLWQVFLNQMLLFALIKKMMFYIPCIS